MLCFTKSQDLRVAFESALFCPFNSFRWVKIIIHKHNLHLFGTKLQIITIRTEYNWLTYVNKCHDSNSYKKICRYCRCSDYCDSQYMHTIVYSVQPTELNSLYLYTSKYLFLLLFFATDSVHAMFFGVLAQITKTHSIWDNILWFIAFVNSFIEFQFIFLMINALKCFFMI